MHVRAILLSLPVIGVVFMCGCDSESYYNVPADSSKEAAEIGTGKPQKSVPLGKRKVTKPPGGAALKDLKSLRLSN
jgi:hypothetical protein